jgi:cysteinyl-tRNA synthetase
MDDDFNTPQALATIFDLARDINRLRDEGYNVVEGIKLLLKLAGVLGLTLQPYLTQPLRAELFAHIIKSLSPDSDLTDIPAEELIEKLIKLRQGFREAKQWQLADEIRDKLAELGIVLEDMAQGTIWKRKR